jgi:hypothetical protein
VEKLLKILALLLGVNLLLVELVMVLPLVALVLLM